MSALEDSNLHSIAGDLRVTVGKLRRRLREQSQFGDLSWSQVAVLGLLEREGPATVSTLARAERMRPQSMGAIVSSLEEAGHVVGNPDPNDGRQTILSLTPSCREWIRVERSAREDWLFRAIQTTLTEKEQEELRWALDLLKRIADA